MDHRPTTPPISTQQRSRDAAMRRLRHLTLGAAALGAAGSVTLGGLAAVTYAGHLTPTSAALADAGTGTSTSITGSGSTATAAPTAAPTDQLGSTTVVVKHGGAGSGMVTSGGS